MSAAMLLAAGRGTRLLPLTSFLPKPLVPVGLRPLLDWHLDALDAVGVDSVALNASHLGDRIEDRLGAASRRSPRVELLREQRPLGTGGGLLGARELLATQERFLVINADVFHAVDLPAVLSAHRAAGAVATLVVRRSGPGEPWDELSFDRQGRLAAIGGDGVEGVRWRFTGIHVLSPPVFDHLSSPGSLADGYLGLFGEGATIMGYDCGDSLWFDVGAPATYLGANRACAAAGGSASTRRQAIEPTLIAESAEIGAGCSIGPNAVIGADASIGPGSHISDCVVWPGTSVAAGAILERCVVHPGGILDLRSDS